MPDTESPSDYDADGNVRLTAEYAEWFQSAENVLADRASLARAPEDLLITSPLPGSIYVVDPDVPSSRRIPLRAYGSGKLQWHSDSLICRSDGQIDFAVASEGEHRLVVTDPATGREAETRIKIRFL